MTKYDFEDAHPKPTPKRGWYVSAPLIEAFEINRLRGYELRGVVTHREYLEILRRSYNLKNIGEQRWWMDTGFIVGTQMFEAREEYRRASIPQGGS